MGKNVELNVMNEKLSIYVDADACPVKKEILDCATRFSSGCCICGFIQKYDE